MDSGMGKRFPIGTKWKKINPISDTRARIEALMCVQLYKSMLDDPIRMSKLNGNRKDNRECLTNAYKRLNKKYGPFSYKEMYNAQESLE